MANEIEYAHHRLTRTGPPARLTATGASAKLLPVAEVQPVVSVLVPCFNKQPFVAETLDSALAQSLPDIELIVVDDGSTDGSREVLRRYEGRAKVLYEPNRGASAARARALREARGRYVQYLDADDVLLPFALEQRVAALERTGCDVAYSDWQRLRPTHGDAFAPAEVVARTLEEVHADPEIACFTSFWAPPVALLYTRELAARLTWSTTLPVIQDARYLLDAAIAGARFVRVPSVSAYYRDLPGSGLSRTSNVRFVRDVLTNGDEVAALWRARGPLAPAQRQALADNYDYAARGLFREHPELAQHCAAALAELGALRPLGWPRIALALERALGHRTALGVLARVGRPAP